MEQVRGFFGISFTQLENLVWNVLLDVFRQEMASILRALDDLLHQAVDAKRFVVKDHRARAITTRMGTVEFKRRYYFDREEGCYVALLDEELGLEQRQRISEPTRERAVVAAVDNQSYRAAQRELERSAGEAVISHEGIRQHLLKVGETLRQLRNRDIFMHNDGPKLKPAVLYIEADGMWPHLQQGKREELRIAVAYTGWARLTPGSEKYRLEGRRDFVYSGRGEFWDELLSQLEQTYDLSETVVVINGDRAPWIRQGVQWFPQAIYQIDRFHLMRDLKRALRGFPALREAACQAVNDGDPNTVLHNLRMAAAATKDPERRQKTMALLRDLQSMPEAMVDYRRRLQARGICTEGMRGIGVAEGAIARYSARLRRLGRSWSKRGLQAMVLSLIASLEGRLRQAVEATERILGLAPLSAARERASHRAHEAVAERLEWARPAGFPALRRGRTASGGMSWFLRRLRDADSLTSI